MQVSNFEYISSKIKERAFSVWSKAVEDSRKGETKAGTEYMGYTVKGLTNSSHEGFSEVQLEELVDILVVLSQGEDRELFVSELIESLDHFFRQEDLPFKSTDMETKARDKLKRVFNYLQKSEDTLKEIVDEYGGSEDFCEFCKFKIDFEARLQRRIDSWTDSIEKHKKFNSFNYVKGRSVGQGNKEAIVKLFNLFIRVLSKWKRKDNNGEFIDKAFMGNLNKKLFLSFALKEKQEEEDLADNVVILPRKFEEGNTQGVVVTAFKLVYHVVVSLNIENLGTETIAKIYNERRKVVIPKNILVKADDAIEQIQKIEEESDRLAEPYILFPDGSSEPCYFN